MISRKRRLSLDLSGYMTIDSKQELFVLPNDLQKLTLYKCALDKDIFENLSRQLLLQKKYMYCSKIHSSSMLVFRFL